MQRALLRERISLVESRTMIKNRIHALLDKYEIQSTYTDIFGKRGHEWLRSLNLPSIDQTILQRLEELEAHIDAFTGKIAQEAVENPQAKLLTSLTGIDYYSAMLLASEIGDVTQFSDEPVSKLRFVSRLLQQSLPKQSCAIRPCILRIILDENEP